MPAEGFSFSTGVVPVLTVLLMAAAFEELGWRGYAFDSLLSRFNYFKSSLIFSILWSLWHLPLILVKDSYQYEIMQENMFFAVNFFVSIIPMGFIISWICIKKQKKAFFAAVLFSFHSKYVTGNTEYYTDNKMHSDWSSHYIYCTYNYL